MHSKILCQRVRYCFPDEIVCIYGSGIILKDGKQMRVLTTETQAQYQFRKTTDEPGTLCEETLTLTVKHPSEIEVVRNMPAIFLLDTDAGQIVMGSILYPCSVEVSNDGRETQLTIKAAQF
jgi:hypothetical protein